MNLKNFDELLLLLEEKAIIQNELYKEFIEKENTQTMEDDGLRESTKNLLLRETMDSPQYLDIKEFTSKFPKWLSDNFKVQIVELINNYELYNYDEHWLSHFYLLVDSCTLHSKLNYQKKCRVFYGDDKTKYRDRLKAIFNKAKRNNEQIMLPELSPKELIQFFQNKNRDILLSTYNFQTNHTISRFKDEDRNIITFDLIKCITFDNYYDDISNKEKLRISKSSKKMYEEEQQQLIKKLTS